MTVCIRFLCQLVFFLLAHNVAGTQALAGLATTQGPRGRKGKLETQTNCWLLATGGFIYFLFSPRILGEMIQFDLRIFFKWVGEKPPTSLVAAVPQAVRRLLLNSKIFWKLLWGLLTASRRRKMLLHWML